MLHLWRGHFHIDNDGSEGGLEKLCGMVDSICIQDHQLQAFCQLKYSLNLTLYLR